MLAVKTARGRYTRAMPVPWRAPSAAAALPGVLATDNTNGADSAIVHDFLATRAEDQMAARSARRYAAHLARFRHDAAGCLDEAVNLRSVAALLGHCRLDTMRVYSPPDRAALKHAADALER